MKIKTYKIIFTIIVAWGALAFAQEADALRAPKGVYWGIGAGVALGNSPLFDMWRRTLPDSLSRLGLGASFGRDTEVGAPDTLPLKYGITETPDEFNFSVPFNFTVYLIRENYAASAGVSLFYNSKVFQSKIERLLDSTDNNHVNLYNTMQYYSVTFEASYHLAIPPEYFSISGSQKTWVSLTLGASPLQYLNRDGDVKLISRGDDARMAAVADSVKNVFKDLDAFGAAITWKLGVSTSRINDRGNGAVYGLYYGGSYSGWFWRNGNRVMNSDVDRLKDGENVKPLAFVSNRMELHVTLIRPTKKTAAANQQLTAADNMETAK